VWPSLHLKAQVYSKKKLITPVSIIIMTEISRRGKGINLPDINIDNFKYWDDPRWSEVKRLRNTGHHYSVQYPRITDEQLNIVLDER
jgi:hypothetical protein